MSDQTLSSGPVRCGISAVAGVPEVCCTAGSRTDDLCFSRQPHLHNGWAKTLEPEGGNGKPRLEFSEDRLTASVIISSFTDGSKSCSTHWRAVVALSFSAMAWGSTPL